MSNQPNNQALAVKAAAIEKVRTDPVVIATQERFNEVMAIKQEVFQHGVHFGPPYPGSKNDTLLKPGATFLLKKYGLRAELDTMERTIHVDTENLNKSYIVVQWMCRIVDIASGIEVSQAAGNATSFEDKYLFREGSRLCPDCQKPTLRKSKKQGEGWYCWQKLDPEACGHKFSATDTRITEQVVAKVVNENPLNLLDTLDAMAQKRGIVRATILATGIDALFGAGEGVVPSYYDLPGDDDVVTITPTTPSTSPSAGAQQTAQNGGSQPPPSYGNAANKPAAPVAGEVRDFMIVSLQTSAQADGKPYYRLKAKDGTQVMTWSRDFGRNWGYREDQIADWNKPGFQTKWQSPLKVSAIYKAGDDGGYAYWEYLDPVKDAELAPAPEIDTAAAAERWGAGEERRLPTA